MLTVCPECSHEVSDKAITCIHCGYPIKKTRKARSKRMRLPNGFGRITKLPGSNLRNPYRVMVTVGKTEDGKPIGKILKPKGYFKTYNEAYQALCNYNKNPYDLDKTITIKELYELWFDKAIKRKSESTIRQIKAAWSYFSEIENMKVCDIRLRHIKKLLEESYRTKKDVVVYPQDRTKKRIKQMMSGMLDYAVENDLIDRNYVKDYRSNEEESDSKVKSPHFPFTEEELGILWEHSSDNIVIGWIIIGCYTGFRPGELTDIKIDDIDMESKIIIGGGKTRNGYRRKIPIHSKIIGLVEKNIERSKSANMSTLISYDNRSLNYVAYAYYFHKEIKKLDINTKHRAHDARVTFATRLTKAGADPWSVKKMMGHSVNDLTERVYVDRDIEWLRRDLEKMT